MRLGGCLLAREHTGLLLDFVPPCCGLIPVAVNYTPWRLDIWFGSRTFGWQWYRQVLVTSKSLKRPHQSDAFIGIIRVAGRLIVTHCSAPIELSLTGHYPPTAQCPPTTLSFSKQSMNCIYPIFAIWSTTDPMAVNVVLPMNIAVLHQAVCRSYVYPRPH